MTGFQICRFCVSLLSNHLPGSRFFRSIEQASLSICCMLLHRNRLIGSYQPNHAVESWPMIQACAWSHFGRSSALEIWWELGSSRLLRIIWVVLILAWIPFQMFRIVDWHSGALLTICWSLLFPLRPPSGKFESQSVVSRCFCLWIEESRALSGLFGPGWRVHVS